MHNYADDAEMEALHHPEPESSWESWSDSSESSGSGSDSGLEMHERPFFSNAELEAFRDAVRMGVILRAVCHELPPHLSHRQVDQVLYTFQHRYVRDSEDRQLEHACNILGEAAGQQLLQDWACVRPMVEGTLPENEEQRVRLLLDLPPELHTPTMSVLENIGMLTISERLRDVSNMDSATAGAMATILVHEARNMLHMRRVWILLRALTVEKRERFWVLYYAAASETNGRHCRR